MKKGYSLAIRQIARHPATRLFAVALLLIGIVGIAPDRVSSDALQEHTLAFPVVYKSYLEGGNTWNTELSLQNIGSGEAAVLVALDGGFSQNYTLQAGESRHISLADLTSIPAGRYAVEVGSDEPLAGVAWVSVQGSAAGHGMYQGVDDASLPTVAYLPQVSSVEDAAGMLSSLHIQNLSGVPLDTVNIDFYNQNGNLVLHENLADVSGPLHLNLADYGLPADYIGSAIINASGAIAAIYSQFRETWNAASIPTLFVTTGVSGAANDLYAPNLLDDLYSTISQLTVQNATDQPTVVTVQYSDGLPQDQVALNPYGSYTFTYDQGAHQDYFGAAVSADQDVVAVVTNRGSDRGGAFEVRAGASQGYTFPVAVKTYGDNFSTRLTVFNPQETSVEIDIFCEGYESQPVETTIFPNEGAGILLAASDFSFLPDDWIGAVKIIATKPIFALGGAVSNAVAGDGVAAYHGIPIYVPGTVPTIEKSADVSYVKPGDIFSYSLDFDAADIAAGEIVTVTDIVPDEVDVIDVQYSGGQFTTLVEDAVWRVEILPNGHGFIDLQVEVTTTVAVDTVFTNTAVIENIDGSSEDRVAVILDVTPPNTAISVAPPDPDHDATPTFAFAGDDGAGSGIDGFECRLDGGSWSACPNPYTLDPLAGGVHTLWVRAVDNVGYIDPSPASHTWEFIPVPNLEVAKSVDTGGVDPVPLGSVVTYTVLISNTGDALASNVVVTDPLPSAVSFGDWIYHAGTVILPPGTLLPPQTVLWRPGDLPVGGVFTLTFTVNVTTTEAFAGTTALNIAYAVADDVDLVSDGATFEIKLAAYKVYLPLVMR